MSKKKKFPPRIPRTAGGIRAQDVRGNSAAVWWAKRWAQALEAMQLGARLGRGRNYAASGQVIEFEIAAGEVRAEVLGARPEPYAVGIVFRRPDAAARARIVAAIKSEPMLVARLIADDLPIEIEEIFRREGYSLFPGGKLAPGKYDVTTACSCPDYANPCKHSAAVLLLLGEEIARRPRRLVELRGITLEELCEN